MIDNLRTNDLTQYIEDQISKGLNVSRQDISGLVISQKKDPRQNFSRHNSIICVIQFNFFYNQKNFKSTPMPLHGLAYL